MKVLVSAQVMAEAKETVQVMGQLQGLAEVPDMAQVVDLTFVQVMAQFQGQVVQTATATATVMV